MPVYFDTEKRLWVRSKQEALPATIKYANELPSGRLVTIEQSGRVAVDGTVELSDANSLALNDYSDPNKFLGYGPTHSGDGHDAAEGNGYLTFTYMGAGPDAGFGTPIWMSVWRGGIEPVRYQMPYAGVVLDSNPRNRRTKDNHCRPQVFLLENGKITYVSGAHHGPIYAAVSGSPWAGFNFGPLFPAGPDSASPVNGHSYPAVTVVGNELHIVSRFTTDGYKFRLVYWKLDPMSRTIADYTVLDEAPEDHTYCIWYQQPYKSDDSIIVPTKRRYRLKGQPENYLSDPEPKTFTISIAA